MALESFQQFINGKFESANETFESIDPATGETFGQKCQRQLNQMLIEQFKLRTRIHLWSLANSECQCSRKTSLQTC
jgi:hypothetical protein